MLHYDSFCFSSDFDDTMFEGGDTGVIHKGCRVPSAGQRGSMALAAEGRKLLYRSGKSRLRSNSYCSPLDMSIHALLH